MKKAWKQHSLAKKSKTAVNIELNLKKAWLAGKIQQPLFIALELKQRNSRAKKQKNEFSFLES